MFEMVQEIILLKVFSKFKVVFAIVVIKVKDFKYLKLTFKYD